MRFLKTKKEYPLWILNICGCVGILIALFGVLLTQTIALTAEQKNLSLTHGTGYALIILGLVVLVKVVFAERKPTIIKIDFTARLNKPE